MAVAVTRDLTVQVLEDANAVKLTDRQKALRDAILRGEPKCLGVSQVMLGLMVFSYSLPLLFADFTNVVTLGVPWWSSVTFVAAGVIAIILDKRCTMKTLMVCLMVSVVSAVLSVVAIIIYSVDIHQHQKMSCNNTWHNTCVLSVMSKGITSMLLVFTLAQTAISAVICFLLNRQRRSFGQYTSLIDAAPHSPTTATPPDLN